MVACGEAPKKESFPKSLVTEAVQWPTRVIFQSPTPMSFELWGRVLMRTVLSCCGHTPIPPTALLEVYCASYTLKHSLILICFKRFPTPATPRAAELLLNHMTAMLTPERRTPGHCNTVKEGCRKIQIQTHHCRPHRRHPGPPALGGLPKRHIRFHHLVLMEGKPGREKGIDKPQQDVSCCQKKDPFKLLCQPRPAYRPSPATPPPHQRSIRPTKLKEQCCSPHTELP